MKPDQEVIIENTDDPVPVAGDVIGDTAYSERFVLKILLKFANLDSLKDEIQEKSFEDDLCTLWDMTAERDVVLYLQKHDVLNLFNFALPGIDSSRLTEIIVGIIGNMCCQLEVVKALLKMDNLLILLLDYMKCNDTLVIVQVLRLISSTLFLAKDDISVWLELFKRVEYSSTLYYIFKNSSNKDLIVTAFENLNTICSYCNTGQFKTRFFECFAISEALESLCTAFMEIFDNRKSVCEGNELERVLVITLQIILNLVGCDQLLGIYGNYKDDVTAVIALILSYYEKKLVVLKEIDTDLVDVIDSTNTIVDCLQIGQLCGPEKYFAQSLIMWGTLQTITKADQFDGSSFEEDDKMELREFTKQIQTPLSTLICYYIEKCSEENLLKVLDDIGEDYDGIMSAVKDEELKTKVTIRTNNYRTRLKDNVDSK